MIQSSEKDMSERINLNIFFNVFFVTVPHVSSNTNTFAANPEPDKLIFTAYQCQSHHGLLL
jgi:hypothetical protein